MVSVCIATYNGADVIREQLESILPQLSRFDEVVVSDDGSTDDTVEIVKAIGSPLVRLIEGPRRHSPIFNFECALQAAKGDIIFLSDQDDRWMPNKVEVMVKALEQYDCVVSDCCVTDSHMAVTAESFYALNGTRVGRFYNLACKNGYLGCCMAFKRRVLERALPFPKSIPMHDIWIGNVAAYYYTIGFIPEKLIMFRRHDHNASDTARKSSFSLLQKLKFRVNVIVPLISRCFGRGAK